MDEQDLKRLLGEEAYAEIEQLADDLRRKGTNPDDVASAIEKKFRKKLEHVVYTRVVRVAADIHVSHAKP